MGDRLAVAMDGDPAAGGNHVADARQVREVVRTVPAEPGGGPAGVAVDEIGRRSLVEHAPGAHRHHPAAEHLGLVEFVGDEQDRGALVAQLRDRPPHLTARGRVEALRQFVEDHQRRSVEQREYEEQALPLAAGHTGERRVAPGGQPEPLQQLVPVPGTFSREQRDGFVDAQPVGQGGVLQLAAEHGAQSLGVAHRITAEHAQHAGVGPAQSLDAFDGGGLAGTVRADQADHLAGAHVEVESVDDDPLAVGLAEPSDGDDVRSCHASIIRVATRRHISLRVDFALYPGYSCSWVRSTGWN